MLRSAARITSPLARSLARRSAARGLAAAAGEPYDVVVIGGGPGGYVASIKAGQLGLRTACVESRGALGGTCLNVGCIPSKALLHSSHLYEHAQHDFSAHGINVEGLSLDLKTMMKSKDKTVKGLTGGIEYLFKKNKVDYIKGHGRIPASGTVVADLIDGSGQTELKTKNILIATGSEPTPLPPTPVDNDLGRIVDSTGALALKEIPKSMAVIGGGVIGLEMGSVWRRLGSEVHVVEFLDSIVPSVDKEMGKEFHKILAKQGMQFHLGTKVTKSEVRDNGVTLTMEPSAGGDESTLDVDVVLVATGRRPFTGGLGLEELGVEMDRFGRVKVDHDFRTNVANVWAIGDVIDGPMLAHKAEEEGIAAVENMAGLAGHVNYDAIPGVIYTHPEVASVGKTEEQLKEEGIKYTKGVFPFQANSRARAVLDTDGKVKFLADAETDRILGVTIVGPAAGELITECVLGIEYGASAEDLARTCAPHPSLSESVKEAAAATAFGSAIHF